MIQDTEKFILEKLMKPLFLLKISGSMFFSYFPNNYWTLFTLFFFFAKNKQNRVENKTNFRLLLVRIGR